MKTTLNSPQCWLIQLGGLGSVTLHPPAHMALPLHEIFIKTTVIFSLSLFVLPIRRDLRPVNAVLMQIRPQESTYYKQLTFVLIY